MDDNNFKAFVERAEGKMIAVASDETQDRHGDSLKAADWDLRNFKKNPVLQFAHDYSQPPIGVAKNIKRDDTRLTFEPVFHEFTELARNVGRMYAEGIMNAFSVGFIPHTEGEKTRLELLEISAVPVPANPSALVLEKALETKASEDDVIKVKSWLENEVIEKEVVEIKADVEAIEKAGRVLSKKNRATIESAIGALKEVLDADVPSDTPADEPVEETVEPEITNEKQTKGRSQSLLLDRNVVEAIANNIGFIARKVKKL